MIISFDLWKEILLNSYIKKEEIELALRNSKYYSIEEINSWKLLYNYYDLDDDIFEKLTQDVNTSANIGVNQDIYVGENFIAKGGILNATELKNEVPENNAEY